MIGTEDYQDGVQRGQSCLPWRPLPDEHGKRVRSHDNRLCDRWGLKTADEAYDTQKCYCRVFVRLGVDSRRGLRHLPSSGCYCCRSWKLRLYRVKPPGFLGWSPRRRRQSSCVSHSLIENPNLCHFWVLDSKLRKRLPVSYLHSSLWKSETPH